MPPPPLPRRHIPQTPSQRGPDLQGFQQAKPASRASDGPSAPLSAIPHHTRRRLTTPYTPNGVSRQYRPPGTPRPPEYHEFRPDLARSGHQLLHTPRRAESREFRPALRNEHPGDPSVSDFTPAGRPRDDARRRLSTPYNPNARLRPLSTPRRQESTEFRPALQRESQHPAPAANFTPSTRHPRQDSSINYHFPLNQTPQISANDPVGEFRFAPIEGLGMSLNGDILSDARRLNDQPLSRAWTGTPSSRKVDTSGRETQLPSTPGPIVRSTEPHGFVNSTSRAPPLRHAGLNSLSFVDVPYSTENQPLASPRRQAAANSAVQHPRLHQSVAVPHWAEHSSSTYTPGRNMRSPSTKSIGRPPGIRDGQSRGFPNASRNFYSDHLKPHKRASMPPVAPYSLGMRSSRAGRTLSKPM
jgi:hypothetical protein